MFAFLEKTPVHLLLFFSILMALAPFNPQPHIVEKIIMLKEGTLTRAIDIFDLFFHFVPTIFLIMKLIQLKKKK